METGLISKTGRRPRYHRWQTLIHHSLLHAKAIKNQTLCSRTDRVCAAGNLRVPLEFRLDESTDRPYASFTTNHEPLQLPP